MGQNVEDEDPLGLVIDPRDQSVLAAGDVEYRPSPDQIGVRVTCRSPAGVFQSALRITAYQDSRPRPEALARTAPGSLVL